MGGTQVETVQTKVECPHCRFLAELFKEDQIESNREYWIMTEVFVYLHDGKDYCNFKANKNKETKQ